MKAIILAGGKGLRLREVVNDVPKPMSPVGGKPFLEYIVLQLKKNGIDNIVLATGYKGETIKSHFGNGSTLGVKISYSEETEQLGTGGAIKLAGELVGKSDCMIMNGDSFFDIDFNKLTSYHYDQGGAFTIALVSLDNIDRYGGVEIDEHGMVLNFTEKGGHGAGLINSGIYICNSAFFSNISNGKVSLEKEVLPDFIGKSLFGMPDEGFFIDIGIPDDYLSLCRNYHQIAT